jgi:methyl-accepting chemotaxis protein
MKSRQDFLGVLVLRMKDMKISAKLAILVGTVVAGLLTFSVLAYSTVDTVKITGAIYKRIRTGLDLQADSAPATVYIGEGRMWLLALMMEEDRSKFQKHLDEFEQFHKTFDQSHQDYNRRIPDGHVKELLNGESYKNAQAWFQIAESSVIPRKMAGDTRGALEAWKEMPTRFEAHHKAAVDLTEAITAENLKLENDTHSMVVSRTVFLLGIDVAILAIVVLLGWYTSRAITGPLSRTVIVLQAVGTGDLRDRVTVDSKDESGIMGNALNTTLDKISLAFHTIGGASVRLATASEEFSATSQQITANSEETSAQANVVSAATEQVNRNLQTVATATEEMSASISEIAKNASEAAKVAGEALKAAVDTNATVNKLGESSAEIGQVIKVITSIAQQTNLLALNATIEAARAGEAGKGFAVVANEVKELAKQTAKATEDISQKIAAIQTDAKGAVLAIGTISGIIGRVNDISATIATAVEEQSATTSEMSRNVSEAAKGSGEVSKNITGVAQAAQSTSSGATDSQKAAQSLSQMSNELRELVGQFRVDSNGHGNRPSA